VARPWALEEPTASLTARKGTSSTQLSTPVRLVPRVTVSLAILLANAQAALVFTSSIILTSCAIPAAQSPTASQAMPEVVFALFAHQGTIWSTRPAWIKPTAMFPTVWHALPTQILFVSPVIAGTI
jgi:hypothetical protein